MENRNGIKAFLTKALFRMLIATLFAVEPDPRRERQYLGEYYTRE